MDKLEATRLTGCWAVRPEGQLGTCGFHPRAWQVCYVKADSAQQAVAKASNKVWS